MNNSLEVVFCSEKKSTNQCEINTIYVCSKNSSWNDFKHKTHGMFILHLDNSQVFSGEIIMSVKNEEQKDFSDYIGLGNLLNSANRKSELKLPEHSFFSLLPSISDYRNLVRNAGVAQASRILSALNDLVFTNEYNKSVPWLIEALNSDVFHKSFMRNSEPFFAFYNAADIIKGLKFEELDYISSELDLSFKLDMFNNKHELKLRFGSGGLLPKRINILIGENGLGKSQALNHFARAALQQKDYVDNLIDPSSETKRPMINRLLAIGTPGETTTTYPSDSIKNPKLNYRRLLLTRNSRSKASRTIGKSIVQLARLDESISQLDRWEIFIEAIKIALPLDRIRIPLNNDSDFVPLKDLRYGWSEEKRLKIWSEIADNIEPKIEGKLGLYPMSSGQLSFFKFSLLACLYIENGSFVLLDEPETHLHPSLISDFVTLLDNILQRTGSYALIATHSSYFVREVPRDQVHVFKKDNDSIYIVNPRLKTFGANVGDISYFVFDEDSGNSLSNKFLDKARSQKKSYAYIKDNYSAELPTEMLQIIKREL
ncbi:AAA family ATPase [Oceanisphaera profunda]|uniref:AAA family ATPase n=1 Tax=Oceanisphaera profunda TaxID=1416627 RepID=UPI00137479D4|nr:AAA family ATPase [Oceanisphaera profunda]